MWRTRLYTIVLCTYLVSLTCICSTPDTKDIYPSITKAIKQGIYSPTSGIGAGIAASIVHSVARILNGSWLLVSTVASYCTYMSQRGFNCACRRPDPLESVTVQCWYEIVEQLTYSLCEQRPSGALLLRSLRVQDTDGTSTADTHWVAYRQMVERILTHIIIRITKVLPYYQGGKEQRTWLVSLSHGMVAQDRDTIVFLLHEVIQELTTVIQICNASNDAQEVPVDELRRILRTTLLLIKKIDILINPAIQQEAVRLTGGLGTAASVVDTTY